MDFLPKNPLAFPGSIQVPLLPESCARAVPLCIRRAERLQPAPLR